MATHGWCDLFESNIQETSKGSIAKVVQEISKSESISAWQIENATKYVEAFGYVECESKTTKANE